MNKILRLLFPLFLFLVIGVIPFHAPPSALASAFNTTQNANIGAVQCSDGIDNDGDSLIDFPSDPGCSSVNDVSEVNPFQCSDGIDNDGDSFIDYPADIGCTNASDNDETDVGGGGDNAPPNITALSPADNSSGVSTSTTLVIDFNEPVSVQTGNIRIKKTSDGSTVQTIAVTSPPVVFTPNARLTITITPLAAETSYYIELDSGIVKDTAGNAFSGLSGSTAWNFSTGGDATPPQISGVSAVPQATLANLAWMTDELAVSSFFWGTTTDYSAGSGTEVAYSLNHNTTLSGLSPATSYYFKIETRDGSGNKSTATGSFTTLAVIDTTPPANPSGFTATAGTNSIVLSWTNPSSPDFDVVKINRSTANYPANPNDGTVIYQGSAEETFDASISTDVRYYYTIFARDTSLNYSSGAIATAIVSTVPIVTPPPTEPPTPTPQPGGEGVPVGTSYPPTTIPPVVLPPPEVGTSTPPISIPRALLVFSDFDFFEQNKKITVKNNELSSTENNEIKISLNITKTPQGAKFFVVSVQDPATKKISSYLLKKERLGTAYETVLSPFSKGKYPVNIKIYDGYNSPIADVNGILAVISPAPPLLSLIPQSLTALTENITPSVEAVAPVAAPIGAAIGVSQAVVLAGNVGSFYDLYLLFLKFLGLLTGFFRKKKPEPWGVVYDSVTKQPIDPAYVVVEHTGQGGKKSAITDLDGRYGFLLSPGTYSLMANKTHYKFPSDQLYGKSQDELYDNLYFGSPFDLAENQILRYNIPLDPVEFDWNEFAKNKGKIFSLYSRRQKARAWIFNSLFYIGLGIASYATVIHPSKLNEVVLIIYGAIIVFQTVWKRRHKVTILRQKNGDAIPFALISATMSKIGILSKKVVSDEFGRFYLLVAPGTYDITVEEKQLDGSYAQIYQKSNVYLKKGVLNGDIITGE